MVLREPRRLAIVTAPDRVPTGAVAEHLRALAATMPTRGGRARPWWLPPETITLPLDTPSLLVPRIAGRLRAVHVPAGVPPINHNLSVARPRDGMTLDDLREALTCARAQAWVADTAPRLENGYLSISTRFLRELPVCGVQVPPARVAAAA